MSTGDPSVTPDTFYLIADQLSSRELLAARTVSRRWGRLLEARWVDYYLRVELIALPRNRTQLAERLLMTWRMLGISSAVLMQPNIWYRCLPSGGPPNHLLLASPLPNIAPAWHWLFPTALRVDTSTLLALHGSIDPRLATPFRGVASGELLYLVTRLLYKLTLLYLTVFSPSLITIHSSYHVRRGQGTTKKNPERVSDPRVD